MKQQMPALGVWLGKAESVLLSIVILATLAAPALIQMSGRASDTRLLDNRPPAAFPTLPRSPYDIEAFRDGAARFIDDNFGLRVELVQLDYLLHWWLGESSVPGMVTGKGGWAFLKADQRAFDQFRGLNRFTDAELDRWIDTMEAYRAWLEDKGIAFVVMVAPNQETVYPDKMPIYANRVWPEKRLDQIVRRLRERQSRLTLVDPRADMWAERKHAILYHKYENHWNGLGAFVGYRALMQAVTKILPQVEPLELSDFTISTFQRRWQMPPLTETEPYLIKQTPSKIVKRESLGPAGPQQSTLFRSTNESAPSLLVYGDSFAEAGPLGWLAESFKSTIYVNTNHYSFPDELIAEHRPTLVVYEMVERYLARPLGDPRPLQWEILMKRAPALRELLSRRDGVGGHVDGILSGNNSVHLTGWAVDKAANAPAKTIYAYDGEQIVGAALPSFARPDVTAGMSDPIAGFELRIKAAPPADGKTRRIRLFSVNPSGSVKDINVPPETLATLDRMLGQQ